MLGSDGVFDALSDQARIQCVGLQERSKGPETSPQHLRNPQNVFQEVADIIWRAMAGDGKDAVRWGQCTVVFKEEILSLSTGGLPKKW